LSQFPDQVDGLSRSALVFQAQGNFLKAADYTEKAIAFMRNRKDEYDSEIIEKMEKDLQNFKGKMGDNDSA
jgi:prefoldin subunit 5